MADFDDFDYLAPEVGQHLHTTLADMQARCPVAHSDAYGGYWILTRYEDVLRVAQDWRTFSSEHGVSVPGTAPVARAIPEHVDPPLHREYKRIINAWFTPAVVARYEPDTRALVNRLIDAFVDDGTCDFMAAFARPFPGLAFFDLVLHAPPDELAWVNEQATIAGQPNNPARPESAKELHRWIVEFLEERRRGERRHDVVDAILHAEVEGRPITDDEVVAMVHLLILGGLETTAGALGQFMIRFCREPAIPDLLRNQPDRIPDAVEELLRLDGPFIAIARTAMDDTDIDGAAVRKGEKVLIYWSAANRDGAEFDDPHTFRLDRASNRHIAFGAGPHRCAGSNLARMNLRIAVHELLTRLGDLRLAVDESEIRFHSALNRVPLAVPITFTAG